MIIRAVGYPPVTLNIRLGTMKHVDVVEYNPFEAGTTNVLGTQHVIETAIDAGVKRVLLTSSDKAVDPANTMGTTKLLAEKLVTAANEYGGADAPRFAAVRFGNVLHSSRSVLPRVYLPVRKPPARGEYGHTASPSAAHTSRYASTSW